MTGKTVLITGATGALGPAVLKAFAEDGWFIRTLSRRAPSPGTAAAAYEHFRGDILDESTVRRAVQGANVVVHMAAMLHIIDPPAELLDQYREVNVGGTSAVIAAAREASVERIVLVSSICVYGSGKGRNLDEASAVKPDTPYAASKREAEQELLRLPANGNPDGVVLRLAAVYGPGVKGNYERLVRAIAQRRYVPVGGGGNRRTLIFEYDVARAIVLAASHPAASGRIFNVTDGEIHTVASITAAIYGALGRKPPKWRLPARAVLAAALPVEASFRMMGRRPPISRQILAKYLEDVAVSGEAMMRELGFTPRWDLERGWHRAIEEMKRVGRI